MEFGEGASEKSGGGSTINVAPCSTGVTIGFVEDSGWRYGIQFKRSVIENQDINEAQARYVCELIQALIEQKVERT